MNRKAIIVGIKREKLTSDEKIFLSKEKPWGSEGYESCEWVLLDYLNIVVHIFQDKGIISSERKNMSKAPILRHRSTVFSSIEIDE